MEVRIESMVCLWDDKIPTMFIEFVNLLEKPLNFDPFGHAELSLLAKI